MMLALTYGAGPSIAVAQPARLQDELYRTAWTRCSGASRG
jgi:hypothetical protein